MGSKRQRAILSVSPVPTNAHSRILIGWIVGFTSTFSGRRTTVADESNAATAGDLRKALDGVDDSMRVILRVTDEDGVNQFMCEPSWAMPDPGCGDVEAFIIDGTDGEHYD